jgi:tetratricopeptide (TPR) repeat protein
MMRVFAALFLTSFPVAVLAQTTPSQQLARSSDLIQQGQPAIAENLLTAFARSPSATASERGRAFTLLGYALKEEGKFQAAQQSFETALRLLDTPGNPSVEYAAALDYDAGLQLLKRNPDLARKLLHQAAAIADRLQNHAKLSSILVHLAGLDIQQQRYREARTVLQTAKSEFHLAGDSGRENSPDIYGTGGWLAILTRKPHQAVSEYAAALRACQDLYGENHMLTGWAYLLLGHAQAADRDLPGGLVSMQTGLDILKQTIGINNARYLTGQLAYSSLLNDAGSHDEANRISSAANHSLESLHGKECPQCSVSVWDLQHR